MKLANIDGRAAIVTSPNCAVDVEQGSDGLLSADPQSLLADWASFLAAAPNIERSGVAFEFTPDQLRNPVPRPRQVFAIGLNYAKHAAESKLAVPSSPTVFTKFPSCLAGPYGQVSLPPDGKVDWEVELVVVMAEDTNGVSSRNAWDFVAGVTIGQDISDRARQFVGPAPQFSLSKSLPGFGPMGPYLVTPDEFDDPDNIVLSAYVNGDRVQFGATGEMVFSVPDLIESLSAVTTLYAGDVIFTGTPDGVGHGREPQVFLSPGDLLVSKIDGIGEMRHELVAAVS